MAVSTTSIRLRSAVPGRERWEVDAVRDNPGVARLLVGRLIEVPGITSAEANPLTGRVLVRFRPDATRRMGDLLSTAVTQARRSLRTLRLVEEEFLAERTRMPRPDRLVLLGGGVLAAGIAVAQSWISLSVLVGVGTLAVTAAVIRSAWKQSHWSSDEHRRAPWTGEGKRLHPLQRPMRYADAYKGRYRLAMLLSAVNKLLDIAPMFLAGLTVSILTGGPISIIAGFGFATVGSQMGFVVGLTAVIWILESAFQFGEGVLWRDLSQTIQHELRMDAYQHLQNLELRFFEDETVGDLAALLNDDVNQLHLFLDANAGNLVQVAANLAIVGPLFYVLAPGVAWIAVLPIPLIVWGSFFYENRTARRYTEVREKAAEVNSRLVGNMSGITTIKSFTTEQYEIERINELSQAYRESNRVTDIMASSFRPIVRMAVLVGFAGSIGLGSRQVMRGTMGAGKLTTVITLMQRFLWPVVTLGTIADEYQRAMAAASRVLDVLEIPLEAATGTQSLSTASVRGDIVFDQVSFGYADRAPALHDLSFHIEPGQTVALVGPTGAGKTTIIKLLLRFHEYETGRVLLDGQDIRDVMLPDLRRAIGLVSQDVFLFDGTIQDNIAYGSFGSSREAVIAAARSAEAHGFIMDLPQGYDTVVGERGVKLSGGQRQRICLARAILKDPRILILDEATSSVDNETEAAIQRALVRVSEGRTTIIIAHRLSTVRHADTIYVLDETGTIVERGCHDALLAREGLYAMLWRVQSGMAILEETDDPTIRAFRASHGGDPA